MAASPAIDLGEPLAALFKRARVADSLYRRYEGRLAELGVGDAGDLLEEVAEKGIGSLDIHDRQAEKLRQALLGRRGWGDAAAVLASLSGLSLGDTPAGVAAGDQAAGGGAAAGGEGRGGARPQEADGGACDAQAAEGGSGGGTEGSSLDPLEPALPESGDGTIAAAGGEEEVEGAAAAAEAGRRAPKTLIVADPSATRHTDTGHSSQPLAASAGASDSTYSGADAEEAVAGGGSGAAEASAAATAEEDKRVRALRIALQHRTQMPVTDEEARAILQARGGRETPVTEEEARVIFRARGDAGRGRATFQARARGRGGRATASPALASKGGEKLSRRGKKAVAKEAGEVVSREEGEAIYRATLESLLASTGWTPRAAEEMAREEQRAHVRQMRWAREHGRGEPVRCFDAEEYDEGDDAFDALFDGGSGYGWDSPSGGGAFF